ncbi:MAG TPA: Gfo/Idh/MocA family oxidoreductase [Acetobacteraceae bacterium]|nr:Gfo/Idh/MocA family oxidoreductase [Acetobacteraceae bacterium]
MTDRIGVGVIGTGFMGRCHALAWRAVRAIFDDVPRPELIAICDVVPEAAGVAADTFGFGHAAADWHELVADPAIAVISITTPNALHREMAVAALAAGKHVWCEKPMALTLADAEAMAEAARTAAGRTILGYNYARNPLINEAQRLIADGAIGRVFHVRGIVDEDYSADPDLPWSWRLTRDQAGLGALGDLGCHLIAMLQVLVGPITQVQGDCAVVHADRPIPDRPGKRGIVDNEDLGQALVHFANGASGVIAASRVAWGRKNRIAWEVHGSKGTLCFDQERMNELALFTADGPAAGRGFRTILAGPQHPPFGRFCPAPGHGLGFNDLKVIEAATLLQAIRTGSRAVLDFEDGLHVERTIHAIARAGEAAAWVRIRP